MVSTNYCRKIDQMFFPILPFVVAFKGHFSYYLIYEICLLTGHRFFSIYWEVIQYAFIFFFSRVSVFGCYSLFLCFLLRLSSSFIQGWCFHFFRSCMSLFFGLCGFFSFLLRFAMCVGHSI